MRKHRFRPWGIEVKVKYFLHHYVYVRKMSFMLEVWQHNTIGAAHARLRRAVKSRLTWTARDAHELMGGGYTIAQVTNTIGNMVAGKHVVRVSRGVYRLRGSV